MAVSEADRILFLDIFRVCIRFNNQYGVRFRGEKKYDRSFFNAVNVFVLIKALNQESIWICELETLTSNLRNEINDIREQEIDNHIYLSTYGMTEFSDYKQAKVARIEYYRDNFVAYAININDQSSIRQYFTWDRFNTDNFCHIYMLTVVSSIGTEMQEYMMQSLIRLLLQDNKRIKKITIRALKSVNFFARNRGYVYNINKLSRLLFLSIDNAELHKIIGILSTRIHWAMAEVVHNILRSYYVK